jgi:hypothetical protein
MLPALFDHSWQSTLFAGAAGLLTLALRSNHARVRHWVAGGIVQISGALCGSGGFSAVLGAGGSAKQHRRGRDRRASRGRPIRQSAAGLPTCPTKVPRHQHHW